MINHPPKKMDIKNVSMLSNCLLVSCPAMNDKEFRNTVIYVCHHDDEGAMGFILNRPSRVLYSYVVQQLELKKADFTPEVLSRPMLIGGPVNRDRGFILHLNEGRELVLVKPNSKVSLKEILTRNPEKSEFFFGHSGWQAGQLEEELRENTWQVIDTGLDELLATPIAKRHGFVWNKLGTSFASYSNFVGHA